MDNSIIVILIIVSIVSSVMKGIKKKQAEEQKRIEPTHTPGQTASPRTGQRSSTTDKPMPAYAFGSAAMPEPAKKPMVERKVTDASTVEGYTTIRPRYETTTNDSSEGASFNDLVSSWEASTAVLAEEEVMPGIELNFNGDSLVKGFIFNQVLERPRMRARRTT